MHGIFIKCTDTIKDSQNNLNNPNILNIQNTPKNPKNNKPMKRLLITLMLLSSLCASAQTKPFVRWWWNGDKVDTIELKRELHLLHEAGIGGVEINPIEFPAKRCDSLGIRSLTWLSDEWIEALSATLREAKRLGMQCDLLVGSGWPFGSETIPMNERAQVMLTYTTEIDWTNNTNNEPFVITRQQIFDAIDPKVTEPNADRQFELVDLFIVPDSVYSIYQLPQAGIPHPTANTCFMPWCAAPPLPASSTAPPEPRAPSSTT